MVDPNRDRRPPMVVAADLASQVTSVCLLMALPAGLGYWGDRELGTSPVLVIVGALLGLVAGIWQLVRLVGGTQGSKREERKPDDSHR